MYTLISMGGKSVSGTLNFRTPDSTLAVNFQGTFWSRPRGHFFCLPDAQLLTVPDVIRNATFRPGSGTLGSQLLTFPRNVTFEVSSPTQGIPGKVPKVRSPRTPGFCMYRLGDFLHPGNRGPGGPGGEK